MQEPIRYSTGPTALNRHNSAGPAREVGKMVRENAAVVVGRRGCCMTHVVRRLLQALGANPAVCEVEEGGEDGVARELGGGGVEEFPVVFVGGRWVGGLERVMAMHITGELEPLLKEAGALWL